jgi:hypothetical protein
MNNTIHNHETIESTTDGRNAAHGHSAPDGERQARKPRRFQWLLDESVFQGFLLVAVLVALVEAFSSVNYIGIA